MSGAWDYYASDRACHLWTHHRLCHGAEAKGHVVLQKNYINITNITNITDGLCHGTIESGKPNKKPTIKYPFMDIYGDENGVFLGLPRYFFS